MSSLLSSIGGPIIGVGEIAYGLISAVPAGVRYLTCAHQARPRGNSRYTPAQYRDLTTRYEGRDLTFLRQRLRAVDECGNVQRCFRHVRHGLKLLAEPLVQAGIVEFAKPPYKVTPDEYEFEARETAALNFHMERTLVAEAFPSAVPRDLIDMCEENLASRAETHQRLLTQTKGELELKHDPHKYDRFLHLDCDFPIMGG